MFSWSQSHLKYRYFGNPKQQESSKAAMQHSESPIKQLSSQQLSCNIKKASRARGILIIFLPSPGLGGISKIIHFCTQIPRWSDITITYYLLYKSYVFMMPKPPKIQIFWYPKAAINLQSRSQAPVITNKAGSRGGGVEGWCGEKEGGERTPSQAGAKPAAKLYVTKTSRARGILSIFLPSPGHGAKAT